MQRQGQPRLYLAEAAFSSSGRWRGKAAGILHALSRPAGPVLHSLLSATDQLYSLGDYVFSVSYFPHLYKKDLNYRLLWSFQQ